MTIDTRNIDSPEKLRDITPFSAIKMGYLASILSPKASLFFASIFATVLSSSAPLWVVIFLMITMPLNTFCMGSLWTIFFTQKKVRSVYGKYQGLVNKCLGVTLIFFAVMITFSH